MITVPDAKHADRLTLIAGSYDDLASPEERYVFDALGTFAFYGASLPALAAVTALPFSTCKQLLRNLQFLSLVQEDNHCQDSYKLHQLTYLLSRARLHEREKQMISEGASFADTPTGRMINFYVRYTDTHRENFSELDAARQNIIHAAEQAATNNAWEAAYDLWEASQLWLDVSGHWTSLYFMLEWAVHASRIRENRGIELAKALIFRSTYFDIKGKVTHALRDAEEGLALGYELGNHKTIASALVRVGSIYYEYLNDAEKAHHHFAAAWSICQEISDWDESAYIAYELALSYWSRDDPVSAKDLFEKSIDISKGFFPHRSSLRYEAYCVTSLGNLLAEQGNYEQARTFLDKSLELKAGDQYGTAISINSLARLEIRLGNFLKCLTLLRDALAIYKRIGAVSNLLSTLQEIGDLYSRQREYTKAVAVYEDARHIGTRIEIPGVLAVVLSGLGAAYYELGHYDEAIAALHERLNTLTAAPEQDHYRIGITLRDMGKVYYRQGGLNAARSYFEQAQEELLEAADTTSAGRLLAEGLLQIGQEHTQRRDHNKALIAYQDGLEMVRSLPEENAYQKGVFLYKIGKTYAALERHNEAVNHFEQAYQTLKGLATPLEVVAVLEDLEESCRMVGSKDKADAVHKDLEPILADADKSDDSGILTDLADYYIEHEKLREAQMVLARASTLLEQHQPANSKVEQSLDIGRSYHILARAYERSGMYVEALTSYQKAAQLLESRVRSQVYGVLMHDIGDVYRAQDLLDQAIIYYEKALEFKDEPSDITRTLRVLADVYAEQGQHEKALAVYREGLEKLKSLS